MNLTRIQLFVKALLVCACGTGSQLSIADPVYKVIDKDGNVTYTDTAPTQNDEGEVTTIETDSNVNIMDVTPELKERQTQRKDEFKEKQKERKQRYEEWQQELAAAKAALKAAEEALEAGKEVKEGDFVGYTTRTGGRAARPTSEYVERVENLEKQVKQARENLANVRKQRPAH